MSEFGGWLRIRNWSKWQTYRRDRGQPPWIKVHREVMRNPDWVALTDTQRGQLVGMWLLAADRDGVIPASPRLLAKLCFMDSAPDLQVFVRHGFIEGDANVASTRRQHDHTEAEAEAEAKKEYACAFEELWTTHKRGPKSKALEEYRKALKKGVAHDKIATALSAYVHSFDNGFKGAHLFRWIRDRRWEEMDGKPKRKGFDTLGSTELLRDAL